MHLRLLLLLCSIGFFISSNAQKDSATLARKKSTEKALFDKISLGKSSADSLVDRYRKKRWRRMKRLGPVGKKYDAGSAWFAIKKLNAFEKAVNDYLTEREGRPTEISGFRFYYIMYGKNDSHAPTELRAHTKGKTKKIHSLLIVATERDKDGVDIDVLDENKTRVAALVMNEGTLCPPLPENRCKGTELGNYPTN